MGLPIEHFVYRMPSIPSSPSPSAVKGLTALTVVSLIVDGALDLTTTARSLLGSDLPLIDDAVTVEHLLAHRSGIGDYLDEDLHLDLADYLMPVPVQQLATTEQYIVALDGRPMKFAPGSRFSYCNGGFVVLALIAERASGVPFHDLVHQRVCEPAGMVDTAFLRSDELPGRAAFGYVEVDGVWRTNVFHLPVRGNGDGGIYTTVADVRSFWLALFEGRIVPMEWVSEMVRPRSETTMESLRYGLGFWLAASGDGVMLEGCDSGVSFRSRHDPTTQCHPHGDRQRRRRRLADHPSPSRTAGGDSRLMPREAPRRDPAVSRRSVHSGDPERSGCHSAD